MAKQPEHKDKVEERGLSVICECKHHHQELPVAYICVQLTIYLFF